MDLRQQPVAIVGMAVTLPGAADLGQYWHNIVTGVDAISEVPPGRWDPAEYRPDAIYCRRGGFVDGRLADFDPASFGIMPDAVPATEPDQLIALRTAAAAIADAGGLSAVDPARVGVVLGRGGYLTPGLARLDQRVRTAGQLVHTLRDLLPELGEGRLAQVRTAFEEALGPDGADAAIGLVPNFAASRIANRLDLRGPAYTVDAACASSLLAVGQAAAELARGDCDMMLAGGVHHCHDVTLWSVFARLRALSPSQRIRPFHRDADGVLMGEGTGVVVLKRLADAVRDGDRVYAVVRGIGIAGDGRATTLVNPDPDGQVRAVRAAWDAAGVDPAAPGAIGLLEAHGTGTPNGDAAEMATVRRVFGTGHAPDAVIGSVKSMIGHTMPAAGAAGIVKAALALHHQVLPPTLHCEDPHPDLLATRFRPTAVARPWAAEVRRAGVNAFGFGGINAHVVLEEFPASAEPRRAPARTARLRVGEPEPVLRIAAETVDGLRALLEADDTRLRTGGHTGMGAVRLAVAGPGAERLALARKIVARGRAWGGRRDVWFAPRPLLGPAGGGRTAFLFPGLEAGFEPQGADVARHFGLPRPRWQHARVGQVAEHGAAVVDMGRLLAGALRRAGVAPDALAGHSVGEWTAMAVGGIFTDGEVDAFLRDFDPAALRVPDLVFAAFGAPAARVEAALAGVPGVVLSHDNAPHQSVVCGPADRVAKVTERLRDEGVLGRELPFESGFHTPMLEPCLGPIQQAMRCFTVRPPSVPVWSATICAPFPGPEADIRELAVRHLLEPVRFRGLVESLHAAGIRAFVQAGQGQLPALVADTLADRDHVAVSAGSAGGDGLGPLRRAVAGLWAYGAEPDFAALAPDHVGGTARPGVRLDLDAGPVTLGPGARDRLRTVLRDATGTAPSGAGRLDAVAERFPAAAQLHALLTETADAAATVFTALGTPRDTTPRDSTLRVSLDTMPHLTDHCFYHQRPNWPDVGDRWPVMPATTMIQHMTDAAAAPGGTPVAVHDARFLTWLVAEPAVDVPVTVRPLPDRPGRSTVELGRHARAEIETAPCHPAPPGRWPVPDDERTPTVAARQMYDERWMFHGPLFQGVTAVTALGTRHVRGVLTALPTPGALLDSAGQLLGYWLMATHTDRTVVLPSRIREIRFHGPAPAVGRRLGCHVRITALTETLLAADMQLTHEGTVWCEVRGWEDRRFDSPTATEAITRWPEHSTLSVARPGGWHLAFEYWPDPASRELMMRNLLAGTEREAYAARSPEGRRQWLLGRIAAKDAVRSHLWQHGAGPVFPAEIRVRNDDRGRPHPEGVHGRELPPLDLSLAHCREAAVALVRPTGTAPVGIDIEEITERPAVTRDAALTADERALLCQLDGTALDFTRFWAAKEAAAKAEGTGLRGRPRDFTVSTADGGRLTVRAPSGRMHRVSWAEAGNPPGLRPRQYVVAWTEDDRPHPQQESPS
ncbi:beta-ketoacyl synthase N-terminal-like domain-containing protein [Streptoverticillium reticulum]|uniref:beta-ketoacyl synthase N-terminal-like domain-containing protein n=1 Tax=Streptoverticillium reticulum TaxID=1433415 RepID=UPI0039BF0617